MCARTNFPYTRTTIYFVKSANEWCVIESFDMIAQFVQKLANTKAPKDAKNPWDFSQKGNAIRRKNLEGYLREMAKRKPSVLLVGEAPGYRGCGRAGIPFSSEKIILTHPFFAERTLFDIEHRDLPMAEASASIVWKTFDALDFYPLMWATYPFHPHESGDPLSNRAPRKEEVALGKEFLRELLAIFKTTEIIAVGRVAEKCLADMGHVAHPVRHPSHGGAVLFAEGLRSFVAKRK